MDNVITDPPEDLSKDPIKDVSSDEVMLTTIDNPYDPFTEFEEWYAYDTQAGYNTCGYLARIANTSGALSKADEAVAIDNAIDEILELNVLGVYKRVVKKIA